MADGAVTMTDLNAALGQFASQIAQSVAESVRQATAESTRSVLDASRTAASQEVGAEREMETGTDEAFKAHNVGQTTAWFANTKRTYDEFQHESLESIRRNRTIVDKLISDAQQHDNQRQLIANQALQNAVETANMLGKRTLENLDQQQKDSRRHADLATDAQWTTLTIDDSTLKALSVSLADAIAQALMKTPEAAAAK